MLEKKSIVHGLGTVSLVMVRDRQLFTDHPAVVRRSISSQENFPRERLRERE